MVYSDNIGTEALIVFLYFDKALNNAEDCLLFEALKTFGFGQKFYICFFMLYVL